jgi:hypothetical protein
MVSRTRLAAWLPACVAVSPAFAQMAPPPQPDITITARTDRPEKTARNFITQVIDTGDGQLARFYDKVCLEVVGLPPALRDTFASRFDAVASTVRVPLAKGKCTPNLIVLFVADTNNFMAVMKARHASFFADLGDAQKLAALKPGSIRSWRQLEIRDDVGNRAPPDLNAEIPPQFETPVHTRAVNAVVVMDRQTIVGKSIWQLADYAAMRALAGARPPDKGSIQADSILSLFDPAVSPRPAGLTDLDLTLLAGLYAMKPSDANNDGYAQALGIARDMTRPVKKK